MLDGPAAAIGREPALEELDRAVTNRWPGSRRLDTETIRARFPARKLSAGWLLPRGTEDATRDLWLVCDEFFPYSLPGVALARATNPEFLPHVEQDGMFCLGTAGTLAEFPADIRHAAEQLDAAVAALTAGESGANREDFIAEFASYWTRGTHPARIVHLLLEDLRRSRLVTAATSGAMRLVADDAKRAREWLENAGHPPAAIGVERAAHIFLDQPLYPKDYPATIQDALRLVRRTSETVYDALATHLKPGGELTLTIAFPVADREHVGAIVFEVPVKMQSGYQTLVPLTKGYRAKAMPAALRLDRIAQLGIAVERHRALQVGGQALLDRTAGPHTSSVARPRVRIIGCGVLGSQVALQLAMAGVRRIVLIDSQNLVWQNVGRHVLTGRAVDMNKAVALRANLLERFPDMEIMSQTGTWQNDWLNSPDTFDADDIIVSLTGDWQSDALLNHLARTQDDFPPVVFGWVEPYALAGHAVAVLDHGGCLQCLTEAIGRVRNPVAAVEASSALRREPSCGAFYQPFSLLEAAPAASMIARLVLDVLESRVTWSEHRVWVTARSEFDRYRVSITDAWFQRMSRDGFERIYRDPLSRHPDCQPCRAS